MLSNGLHNLGRKRNKAMVSSLSATDRARVFSSSGRCRSRSVDGCQLSAPLPLSCSPALRATAGATAHRLAQMRRVRPAAVAIFSPEIGFLPRVAQLFRCLPPFLPFRFSGRGKKVGWDRWVDLKIVRFPDPFWDFAPLFLSISRFSLLPPSFLRPFGIGNGGYKGGGFKGALYTWACTFSPFLFTRRFLSVVNFQLSPILWQFWKF